MKIKWRRIGILFGLFLMASNTAFAAEQPTETNKIIKENTNEYVHFTPVTEESLSESEKEFVAQSKLEQGVHIEGNLYLISLGAKPNPGYQLEFVKSETSWEVERIFVKQILPKKGQVTIQLIHYPYIVGRLELPTKYMSVSVLDIDTGKDLFQKQQEEQPVDNGVIKVYINGKLQYFDQPPLLKGNRTMVPLRGIFEALGAQVQFDQTTGSITATKGQLKIKLKLYSKKIKVNGSSKTIDVAPFIQNNRTLVPLRLIGEALEANVSWNEEKNAVLIETKK